MLGPLPREALLRPRLDHRLGAGDLGQPLLAQRQFLGNLHPVGNVRPVNRFGFPQQIGHLRLQLRLDLVGVLIRQRAVAASVGVDLGAVQRHRAELQHPDLAGHAEHVNEQLLDLLEKTTAEIGNGVVVGMLIGGDEAERHRIIRGTLQLAAGEHARGVAVDDQPEQQRGMIRGLARSAIAADHAPQIELLDDLDDEARQMPLRKPFVHRRRHQETRVTVDRAQVTHVANIQRRWRESRRPILPPNPASR